jgi:hypothetical protein
MVKTVMEDLIDQGVAKGELRAHRNILRRVLTRQFGALPDTVLQQIEQASDLERLATAIEQAPRLKSLDELKL